MSTAAPDHPYPGDGPDADIPGSRDRRISIGVIVGALVVLIGLVLWFTRSPGPPTAPVGLALTATTCEEPCDRIRPRVTVAWAPPESGAEATGYRLLRDGTALEPDVDGSTLTFDDEGVTMGEAYEYQVIALSDDGASPATAGETTTVPTPPEDVAHLSGVYRMQLIVRSARSIGSAFGIENPLPGKRGTDRWSFESTCGPDEGACASNWSGLDGDLEPDGTRWRGTVDGLPARCGREGRAPAPIELDLEAIDVGVVDAAWVVTGFRGSARVSFRCPGFPAASATVEVTGSL